jgi:hypothetical protein
MAKADAVTVIGEASAVTVKAEQVPGEEGASELGAGIDEAGGDEEVRTLVAKVVRPVELATTCPLQVPNSIWHFFATSQSSLVLPQ